MLITIRKWTLAQLLVLNMAALLCGAWLIEDRVSNQRIMDSVVQQARDEARQAEQEAAFPSSLTLSKQEVQAQIDAMGQQTADEFNAILGAQRSRERDGWLLVILAVSVLVVNWIWAGTASRSAVVRNN